MIITAVGWQVYHLTGRVLDLSRGSRAARVVADRVDLEPGRAQLVGVAGGGPVLATTPSFNRNGWFIGGGVENNLNIFGISAPGWFMKTEYRSAFYERITLPESFVGGGLTGTAVTFKPWVQTISTSLVYRFNWGGAPIAARY